MRHLTSETSSGQSLRGSSEVWLGLPGNLVAPARTYIIPSGLSSFQLTS
ncbi:MAG: hypothetical protein IKR71_02220 [Bacteroidales bacterium]|nr:hypothetical protein [Bacteroidales bacterium]